MNKTANQKVPLFNPLSTDFKYDIRNDDNSLKTLVMPAQEMTWFEPFEAEYMTKHLTDVIYHLRGNKVNHEVDIETIRKEIEVEL